MSARTVFPGPLAASGRIAFLNHIPRCARMVRYGHLARILGSVLLRARLARYLHGRNVNLSKRSNALRLPEMTKVTGAVQILIFFTVMAPSVFCQMPIKRM